MKSAIDDLIPLAMDAIADTLTEPPGSLKVKSGYIGAIASFGNGLQHNGVQATVAMFSVSGGDINKNKLLEAIFVVLKKSRPAEWKSNLEDHIMANENELPRFKKELSNIAVALKRALRTFNLVK